MFNRFTASSVCRLVCSHSHLFTLGWMCPLKHEQVRCERESGLRVVNSLQTETLLKRLGEKVGHESNVVLACGVFQLTAKRCPPRS